MVHRNNRELEAELATATDQLQRLGNIVAAAGGEGPLFGPHQVENLLEHIEARLAELATAKESTLRIGAERNDLQERNENQRQLIEKLMARATRAEEQVGALLQAAGVAQDVEEGRDLLEAVRSVRQSLNEQLEAVVRHETEARMLSERQQLALARLDRALATGVAATVWASEIADILRRVDTIHPDGRCLCAGEGRCELCLKHRISELEEQLDIINTEQTLRAERLVTDRVRGLEKELAEARLLAEQLGGQAERSAESLAQLRTIATTLKADNERLVKRVEEALVARDQASAALVQQAEIPRKLEAELAQLRAGCDGKGPTVCVRRELLAQLQEDAALTRTAQAAMTKAVDGMNAVYAERNKLVALLARHYPSGRRRTAIEGWDPAWNGCVFLQTPQGQLSWHYHDSEAGLFEDLPEWSVQAHPWDGHTTAQKYTRVLALAGALDADACSVCGCRVFAPVKDGRECVSCRVAFLDCSVPE